MRHDWIGSAVTDRDRNRVGTLDELFVGRTSGTPEFGVVHLDGEDGSVAVPLTGAVRDADAVVLAYGAERVLAAPRMQREVDEIPAEVGALIHEHFGPAAAEVTLSEEQLGVETRAVPTERVHVRKRVVTEDVTVTVTLRREELVIEREPIEPGTAEAPPDAQPVEAEFDFVLLAEQPVIEKRLVPVEQVRVRKDVVVEEEILSDELRKERIDVEELPPTP